MLCDARLWSFSVSLSSSLHNLLWSLLVVGGEIFMKFYFFPPPFLSSVVVVHGHCLFFFSSNFLPPPFSIDVFHHHHLFFIFSILFPPFPFLYYCFVGFYFGCYFFDIIKIFLLKLNPLPSSTIIVHQYHLFFILSIFSTLFFVTIAILLMLLIYHYSSTTFVSFFKFNPAPRPSSIIVEHHCPHDNKDAKWNTFKIIRFWTINKVGKVGSFRFVTSSIVCTANIKLPNLSYSTSYLSCGCSKSFYCSLVSSFNMFHCINYIQ
jgi:hypothetical protein